MREAQPTSYNSIYHIYTQTCSLINECKTFYSRFYSIEVQANSDFTWSRAVKILFISLQYLSALLFDSSAISFHSPICVSSFSLFICSCLMIAFNSQTFNSAARLLSDSVTTWRFYLLISRVNLTLSWWRSSIFVTKLIFDLRNFRNLLNSQLNIELTRISSAYRLILILYPGFWLKRGFSDSYEEFIDIIT